MPVNLHKILPPEGRTRIPEPFYTLQEITESDIKLSDFFQNQASCFLQDHGDHGQKGTLNTI